MSVVIAPTREAGLPKPALRVALMLICSSAWLVVMLMFSRIRNSHA